MSAFLLYRIASVLLLVFAAGHTFGFRQVDPRWGVDAPIESLKVTHFQIQGMSRTYWGFYTGFGLFVSVLLVFAAVLAWQLGGMPREALRSMPLIRWGFALCFVAVTYLSWQYFFIVPIASSGVIAICLLAAAWLGAIASNKTAPNK
jgi:hypothetical protein